MTDTRLRLTGAQGPTIVEGPFGRNSEFINMLGAATGRQVLTSDAATGTSIGAALLFGQSVSIAKPTASKPAAARSKYREYAARWRSLVVL
jgi:sugar (pentulose or hexulose) kinase